MGFQLGAFVFVAGALGGVGELRRIARCNLDQLRAGVLVVVELDQHGGLVEGQLVLVDRGGGNRVVGDSETVLHGGLFRAGPFGDCLDGQSFEGELLERDGAIASVRASR